MCAIVGWHSEVGAVAAAGGTEVLAHARQLRPATIAAPPCKTGYDHRDFTSASTTDRYVRFPLRSNGKRSATRIGSHP
jgi:hypothetical protein